MAPLRLSIFLATLLLIELSVCGQSAKKSAALEALAEKHQTELDYPALWLAVVPGTGKPLIAASGIRKWGDPTPATIDDLIHLGSCSKAMTAALAARLVDQGKLSWESNINSTFPQLSEKIHPDYHDVTLAEMLSHHGGMIANSKDWWHKFKSSDVRSVRLEIATMELADSSEVRRGSYLYSNLGYVVAGLMIEQVLSQSWEEAITDQLFRKLQMESAGFGPPGLGIRDAIEQPWGHRIKDQWVPNQNDNPPALGPAGRVHASIADWAKFLRIFINSNRNRFIKPKTYQELISPRGNKYALGWRVHERSWANGTVLTHSGSNTNWYCVVWIAPQQRKAYIAATNSRSPETQDQIDKVIWELIQLDQTIR